MAPPPEKPWWRPHGWERGTDRDLTELRRNPPSTSPPHPTLSPEGEREFYCGSTVTARRFWAQALSSEPSATGRSLPQLITFMRPGSTPRLAR